MATSKKSPAKKASAKKAPVKKTKMNITRVMIAKALEKVGGDVTKINRPAILARLQNNKSTDMKKGQASRYFHMVMNEL